MTDKNYEKYKQSRIEKIIDSFAKLHYTGDEKEEGARGVFDGTCFGYVKGGYEKDYKQKVLYVEDLDHFANFMKCVFQDDYSFEIALTEKEGLEKIANKEYDVVITDGCLYGEVPDYSGGVNIAKKASEKGSYVIGLSSNPKRFYEYAKDYLTVNYKKIPELDALRYLIANKPTQKEFDDYLNSKK
jgi:hypothetical protein